MKEPLIRIRAGSRLGWQGKVAASNAKGGVGLID